MPRTVRIGDIWFNIILAFIFAVAFFGAGIITDRMIFRPQLEKENCEQLSNGGTFRCDDGVIIEIVPREPFWKAKVRSEKYLKKEK